MVVSVNFKGWFPRVLCPRAIVAGMLAVTGGMPAGAQPSTNARLVVQWQTADGLPENLVDSLVQTHDGYLWVGTFGGLARFARIDFRIPNHVLRATIPGAISSFAPAPATPI